VAKAPGYWSGVVQYSVQVAEIIVDTGYREWGVWRIDLSSEGIVAGRSAVSHAYAFSLGDGCSQLLDHEG
jgi:hypothetical protein